MQNKSYFFEERAIKANRSRDAKNNENKDRFIPARGDTMEVSINHDKLLASELHPSKPQEVYEPGRRTFNNLLSQALFGASDDYIKKARILGFSLRHPQAQSVQIRKKPHSIEQIDCLDAPDLIDNYYINSLCWGSLIYVGLGCTVYTYNPINGKITKIDSTDLPESAVYSLAYSKDTLARAGYDCTLQFVDLNSYKEIARHLNLPKDCRQLRSDGYGGFFAIYRTGELMHYDPRAATSRVCLTHRTPDLVGLAFNENTQSMALVSESTLSLFDRRQFNKPVWSVSQYQAFTKAVAFSPDNNRLITGGGTLNTTIKLWNAFSGFNMDSVISGSQVCGLHWLDEETIISNHGYQTTESPFKLKNSIVCWDVKNNCIKFDAKTDDQGGRLISSSQNPLDKSQFTMCSTDKKFFIWSVKNPNLKAKPDEQSTVLKMPILR